jgi:hypothetical protein
MLQHILITPFSYRRIEYQPDKMPDPLYPRILKKRFQFFEMITAPSLKAQENKDFTWIIVVDPLLPAAYRNKFSVITTGMKNVFVHNFTPEVNENSTVWLKPYIHPQTSYLIISELDADDGVFRGFTSYVQDYYSHLIKSGQIQPIQFLSCNNVSQWDFFNTPKAPLGFIKPWTRANTLTVSAGLTACCKYPETDFSIFSFGHHLIGQLFEDKPRKEMDFKDIYSISQIRNHLKAVASSNNLNWDGELERNKHFHQISTDEIQTVITNNFLNDRFVRIFENHDKREIFDPQTSLPGIEIDYDLAALLIKTNRKTLPVLVRLLWMFVIEKNYVKLFSKKPKLSVIIRLIKGFSNMK